MNRRTISILLGALLAIVVTYNACDSLFHSVKTNSTIIGSPMNPNSKLLLSAICSAINRCHPTVTVDSCSSSVLTTSGIDYQIGLPTGVFPNFASIINAEISGNLVTTTLNAANCSSQTTSLSCDSPQIQGAYNPALSNPFAGVVNMFQAQNASCPGIFGVSTLIGATRRYVRAGATGRGDGTDWINACPDFTGACDGATLVRGATYYVASGTYGTINFSSPGAALTTVKKATITDHGDSTGWQDAFGSGPAVLAGLAFSTGAWVIDGSERSSPTSGYGFQINLPRLRSSCAPGFCPAIYFDRQSVIDSITFRYVEIMGFGMASNRSQEGLYAVPTSGSISNIFFTQNYIHDFGSAGVGIQIVGDGVHTWTISDSLMIRIYGSAIADQGSRDVTVRNNVFQDIKSGSSVIVSDNSGAPLTANNWSIYSNVFYESDPASYGVSTGIISCINGNNCSNWAIYNNTFVNFTTPGTLHSFLEFSSAGTLSSGNVFDNLWYNDVYAGLSGALLTTDYNDYVSVSGGAPPNELHGETGSSNPFVNLTGGNFHLASPTLPGLALSSPYNVDPDGNLRGTNGNWSRGAY